MEATVSSCSSAIWTPSKGDYSINYKYYDDFYERFPSFLTGLNYFLLNKVSNRFFVLLLCKLASLHCCLVLFSSFKNS